MARMPPGPSPPAAALRADSRLCSNPLFATAAESSALPPGGTVGFSAGGGGAKGKAGRPEGSGSGPGRGARGGAWLLGAGGRPWQRFTRAMLPAVRVLLVVWPLSCLAGIAFCQWGLGHPGVRAWLGEPSAASRASYLVATVHNTEEGSARMWGMSYLPLYVPQTFSMWMAGRKLLAVLQDPSAPVDWSADWWERDDRRARLTAVTCYAAFIFLPSLVIIEEAWRQLFVGMASCGGCLFSFMCVFSALQVSFVAAACVIYGWAALCIVKLLRFRFSNIKRVIRGSILASNPAHWRSDEVTVLDTVQCEWLQMHGGASSFVAAVSPFFLWLLVSVLVFLVLVVLNIASEDYFTRLQRDVTDLGLLYGLSYILAVGGFLIFAMVYANDGYVKNKEGILEDMRRHQVNHPRFSLECAAAHNFFQLVSDSDLLLKIFGQPVTPVVFKTYAASGTATVVGSLLPGLVSSGVFGSNQHREE